VATTKTLEKAEHSQARDMLRIASLILIAIGIVISGYLSYTKLTDTSVVCTESGAINCEVVQTSIYSKFMGIEVAYLGLAAYLFLGAVILLESRLSFLQEYGITLVFGITLFAFLFSMWLVYVQVALLQAICLWCLGHEITMTLLFIVSGLRLRQMLTAP
jgi:uncharacterized membrane protein